MHTAASLGAARDVFENVSSAATKKVETPAWNCFTQLDRKITPVLLQSVSGFGYANKIVDGGQLSEQSRDKLVQLSIDAQTRGFKYTLSIKAQKADPYNQVKEAAKLAGKALMQTRERDATNVLLNNAFSSSYPIATGAALFSDAHTIGSGSYDNLASAAALSEASIAAAVTQQKQQKEVAKNMVMTYSGKYKLLVPSALDITASKIKRTTQTLGSNNNDVNVVRDYFDVEVLNEATSATAWALIPMDKDEHDLYLHLLCDKEVRTFEDVSGNVEFGLLNIYEFGVRLPYNMIGNAGA